MLWGSLAITFGLKLALALALPLTPDEAYFVQWGRELAGGYYDHGPMTGWWIWFMLLGGEHVLLVRLPAILSTLAVGCLLWRVLRPVDAGKAAWAATLFLWSPVNVLNVFMTTDVPLIFFTAVAVAWAIRAHRSDRRSDYLLTGAFVGLAFLSKYFAVLLGLALAVAWLGLARPRRVRAVMWMLAGVLPFAAQHVYWNAHHAWVTVIFNFFNRQEKAGLSLLTPLLYVATVAYLLGPGILRGLIRPRAGERRPRREAWRGLTDSRSIVLFAAFAVPHAVFLLVSLVQDVGVHWLVSFHPFAFGVLFGWFNAAGLRRMLRPMIVFTSAHVLLALALMLIPLNLLQSHRKYLSIVLALRPQQVLTALEPLRGDYLLATPSYSKSAVFDFYLPEHVPVLGLGSFHGRQDDLRTDVRALEGRNVMVVTNRPQQVEDSLGWFREAEVREVEVLGARMQVVLGRGFLYPPYREQVLRAVAHHYYRMPPLLERFSTGSLFRERYDLPAPAAGGS